MNVSSAMPVATAVEAGWVRMPNADLSLATWDETSKAGGFRRATRIGAGAPGHEVDGTRGAAT